MNRGFHILIATPGRLKSMLSEVNPKFTLGKFKFIKNRFIFQLVVIEIFANLFA
jgi:hypothetical protein